MKKKDRLQDTFSKLIKEEVTLEKVTFLIINKNLKDHPKIGLWSFYKKGILYNKNYCFKNLNEVEIFIQNYNVDKNKHD